jgi:hypothetical protein
MRNPNLQADLQIINAIFAQEAAARRYVTYLSTVEIFSRKPGEFSPYVFGPDGMPVFCRSSDGIHLNPVGARMLADIVLSRLQEDLPMHGRSAAGLPR